MEYIPPQGNIYQNNIISQARTQEQMLVDRSLILSTQILYLVTLMRMLSTELTNLSYTSSYPI